MSKNVLMNLHGLPYGKVHGIILYIKDLQRFHSVVTLGKQGLSKVVSSLTVSLYLESSKCNSCYILQSPKFDDF